MTEVFVASVAELEEHGRRLVRSGNLEIGVFLRDGQYYAYRNLCFHQGGPCTEGLLMAKVEEIIDSDGTYHGSRFNKDEMHFVCPWHGYEYVLTTGECAPDRKKKLQNFEVVTREGDVYVRV
jgi:nitrite reductase/ring-hydroxylating ferredoxin subunit